MSDNIGRTVCRAMWVSHDFVRHRATIDAEIEPSSIAEIVTATTYDIVWYVNSGVKSNVFNYSDTGRHRPMSCAV